MRLWALLIVAGCSRGEPVEAQSQALEREAHRMLVVALPRSQSLELIESRVVSLPLPTFRGDPALPWQLVFRDDRGALETFFLHAHDEVRGEFASAEGALEVERAEIETPVFPARVPLRAGVLTLFIRRGDRLIERAALRLEATP